MCGRFERHSALSEFVEVVAGLVGSEPELLPTNYNIAPSQQALVVRQSVAGVRAEPVQWGLVPDWAKDSRMTRPINARAETAAERPMFRQAFRRQRCLVLCNGFYEWRRADDGSRQPFHLGLKDGRPFAMAGLWARNEHLEQAPLETFCIVTTEANNACATVHERMPLILPRGHHGEWLDPTMRSVDRLQAMLNPYPGNMLVYPVSRAVNNPANNTAQCIEPLSVKI